MSHSPIDDNKSDKFAKDIAVPEDVSEKDEKLEQPVKDVAQPAKQDDGAVEYPGTQKRILIMASLYLASFLVTLDQNIISTAIPRITDDFHSLNDIGWYGSAYLLTMSSFQLLMGRVYKFYPVKPVVLMGILFFEIGSAICGAAPNSIAFIFGRAISGFGASGLFSGLMVIMFHTIPMHQRPIYQGLFAAVFAIGSVVGPLIGGTFTDKVTWRWCFYINLPVGAVSAIVVLLFVNITNQKLGARPAGFIAKVQQLDPIGNLAFIPGIVCLILALEWGGTTYSWSDARIIVLLVLCGILTIIFIGIQIWKQEAATVPPRIVSQRSIASAMVYGFLSSSGMMVLIYYLPIWFQAVKGVTAVKSGIMLLPMVLSTVIAALLAGVVVSRIGYYTPFFILSAIVSSIGAGLLSTFHPSTGHSKWIGFQVLFGLGLGVGMQQPMLVAQTILNREDIAIGTSIVMFTRFLGSAIFLPVAQSIFLSQLVDKLSNLPNINPEAVVNGGATELRNLASGDDLGTLLADYNDAIVVVFYLVVAMCALTIIPAVFVEWRSVRAATSEQVGKAGKPKEAAEPVEAV